jgi:hypothetical protein
MVKTFTPHCKATFCCLWPCISNAVAWPIWTSSAVAWLARVTTPRQDRNIHLAHLRNRHVTATEPALTTVGNHNRYIHPKTVRNRLREFGLRARRLYNEAMETGLFHRWVAVHSFSSGRSTSCIPMSWGTEKLWEYPKLLPRKNIAEDVGKSSCHFTIGWRQGF